MGMHVPFPYSPEGVAKLVVTHAAIGTSKDGHGTVIVTINIQPPIYIDHGMVTPVVMLDEEQVDEIVKEVNRKWYEEPTTAPIFPHKLWC